MHITIGSKLQSHEHISVYVGMDSILPNKTPYIPQIRQNVTLLVGNPMDFAKDIEVLKSLKKSPRDIRKHITDKLYS